MIKKHLIRAAYGMEALLSRHPRLAQRVGQMVPMSLLLGKRYRYYQQQFDQKDPVPELLKLVRFAWEQVPYYKEKYNAIPQTLEDFERMAGFTDKTILQRHRQAFLSPIFHPASYELVSTSGSTGDPSLFYLPKDRFYKEWAYIHKIWASKGYRHHWRAVLRNHKLDDHHDFRLHIFRREMVFDAYRNRPDYYRRIYHHMKHSGIRYFQSYPHLAHSFFQWANNEGMDVSFLKGVFLSSERFTDIQRRLLVEQMGLPVVSIYGLSEKLALAVDWNGSGQYEIIESYGYVELVDEEGQVIKETGRTGEIVATTLDNYGMPLIRFRTGDISEYAVYEPGKRRILNGILGRTGQYIYNADGSGVSVTSLNMHGDLLDYVQGLQFYQETPGRVEIRLIPKPHYNNQVRQRILNYYQSRFMPDMQILLKETDRLETLKNGKLPALISLVKK